MHISTAPFAVLFAGALSRSPPLTPSGLPVLLEEGEGSEGGSSAKASSSGRGAKAGSGGGSSAARRLGYGADA